MAKNKSEEAAVVDPKVAALEDQIKAGQQRESQLQLEKQQLEQELRVIKGDAFKSREGFSTLLEQLYELLWGSHQAIGRGATRNRLEKQMEVLKAEIGAKRIEELEYNWRGTTPNKK